MARIRVLKLSTGYEVEITKNDLDWIEHLCLAILGESRKTLGKKFSFQTYCKSVQKEIKHVISQLNFKDIKFWKHLVNCLLYYIAGLEFLAIQRGIDLRSSGKKVLRQTKMKGRKHGGKGKRR